MDFFILILASGLGFGLACFIFASLLSKSNDIGNSIGSVYDYGSGVNFDTRANRMKKSEKDTFGATYISPEERQKSKCDVNRKVELSPNRAFVQRPPVKRPRPDNTSAAGTLQDNPAGE